MNFVYIYSWKQQKLMKDKFIQEKIKIILISIFLIEVL
jgi:hypothetical protein